MTKIWYILFLIINNWSTNFYFFSLADHLGVFSGVLKVADYEYNIGFARLALV